MGENFSLGFFVYVGWDEMVSPLTTNLSSLFGNLAHTRGMTEGRHRGGLLLLATCQYIYFHE